MKLLHHLNPDKNLQRLTYVKVLEVSKPMADFSSWLITGIATIIGAILVNVENVSKILDINYLNWGLSMLVIAILFGVIVKQLGIAINHGVSTLDSLYQDLQSPEGEVILENLTLSNEETGSELSSAFLWPLNILMKNSHTKGSNDSLAAEKRFIKMLCIQIYSSNLQAFFGFIGLITLAIGIGKNA